MAPLPVARILPRYPLKPLSRPVPTGPSVKGLVRLRILVYILLITSAVFGIAVLLWKFGYFIRFFTLGRILQDRKPVDTRYIKTWYGWIPQDRYNSQKEAWENLRSGIRRWFSWSDRNDYTQIWWDSRLVREDKRQIDDISTTKWNPHRDPREDDSSTWNDFASSLSKPKRSVVAPSRVANDVPKDPKLVNDSYYLPSRASTYLTFPFCLKPANPEYHPACFIRNDDKTHRKILKELILLSKKTHPASHRSVGRLSIARSSTHNCRRLNYLREWATRLQMGSLQSIVQHHSGLLGRPGSPVSALYSSNSSAQKSASQESCEMTAAPRSIITQCDVGTSNSNTESVPANIQAFIPCGHGSTHWNSAPTHYKQAEIAKKVQDLEQRRSVLDVEIRFLNKVDRNLEWLLNECQPGNRGFKFATLQTQLRWLVYTNPCCASTEVMRRYGDGRTVVDSFEVLDPRRRRPATVKHRRRHIASIDSWRAAINKARRQMEVPRVRSLEFYENSADEPPDTVIDSANWMLRRPPQGFGMSTSQKNSYYYGGIEGWAKLEDWQAVDGWYDNSDNMSKCVSVFAASNADYSQHQQSNVGIICS
jgi:hypothetical protein